MPEVVAYSTGARRRRRRSSNSVVREVGARNVYAVLVGHPGYIQNAWRMPDVIKSTSLGVARCHMSSVEKGENIQEILVRNLDS